MDVSLAFLMFLEIESTKMEEYYTLANLVVDEVCS
jgi:hypothetical protein